MPVPSRHLTHHLKHAAPLTAAALLLLASPAPAQQTRTESGAADELLEVEGALDSAGAAKDTLEARARAASREVSRLQEELVDAAARAQKLDTQVTQTEAHLKGLVAAEAVMQAMLEERRAQLIESLAALQRMDLEPPPALLVQPDDALSAARSALLMGSLVPELKSLAEELSGRLTALEKLKTEIQQQRARLTADQLALRNEQRRIDELLAQRKAEEVTTLAEAARAARRYEKLASKANSLRELLGGLDKAVPTEEAALVPGDEAGRPRRSFLADRGHLKQPVIGEIIQRFGADDGAGGISHGLLLETRPEADVISPHDGEIVFAGPFRTYGNVLIISPGEDYLIVLAGLSEIYGTPGQQLLAGEPVGRMGSRASAGAGDRPVLYIEFRKNGDPVDPAPWIRFANRPA